MSSTEIHIGKAKEIPRNLEISLEEQCKELFISIAKTSKLPRYCESYRDALQYELGQDKIIISNDRIFEILEDDEIEEYMDVFNKREDGIIDYVVSFYNGATCLNEILEENLHKF